jgi:Kef-type K+ transport system membrane component KefB
VLIVASALLASRTWNEGVVSAISRGLTSSSQLPVRMTMLFMLALTAVAIELGLDVLIGAFAAGIVARIASGGHDEEDETVSSTIYANKLEGIGFGMLVPVFFVLSGVAVDVRSLVQDPEVLVLVPVFLVLMLIVRAVPTFICYRHALDGEDRRALSVLSAAGLPLIVVITTIAVENGYLGSADAAAMVAAGMLSVLVFPAIALAMLGRKQSVPSEPGSGL